MLARTQASASSSSQKARRAILMIVRRPSNLFVARRARMRRQASRPVWGIGSHMRAGPADRMVRVHREAEQAQDPGMRRRAKRALDRQLSKYDGGAYSRVPSDHGCRRASGVFLKHFSCDPETRPALRPELVKAVGPDEPHRNDRFSNSVEAFFTWTSVNTERAF